MKFNTDSYFVIGSVHARENKPCQDHAMDTSLQGGEIGICVISDGCSSGGYNYNDNKKVIHTDIGARVITCSAIRALKEYLGFYAIPDVIGRMLNYNIQSVKETLGLDFPDMLATCAYAMMKRNGGYIHVLGDACIVKKYRDGRLQVVTLEWQGNMPFYPIYNTWNKDKFMYYHRQQIDRGDKALKVTLVDIIDSTLPPDSDRVEDFVAIDDAVAGYVLPITKEDMAEIECLAVFSDGVNDFNVISGSGATKDSSVFFNAIVIKEFMAFKSYKGEFVKRRVCAGLKALLKEGIVPNDDFSMAVIHFDNTDEQWENKIEL